MNPNSSLLNIAGIVKESIVDGPGIRYTIFTQGCPHKCEGCHNPETWKFSGGTIIKIEDIFEDILENPLLSGVTFSGGEPFAQPLPLLKLAKKIKQHGLNLISYSGYTFEKLILLSQKNPTILALLSELDILVDGPFLLSKRSLLLKFRGSQNQRLIDVPSSLSSLKVILKEL